MTRFLIPGLCLIALLVNNLDLSWFDSDPQPESLGRSIVLSVSHLSAIACRNAADQYEALGDSPDRFERLDAYLTRELNAAMIIGSKDLIERLEESKEDGSIPALLRDVASGMEGIQ